MAEKRPLAARNAPNYLATPAAGAASNRSMRGLDRRIDKIWEGVPGGRGSSSHRFTSKLTPTKRKVTPASKAKAKKISGARFGKTIQKKY